MKTIAIVIARFQVPALTMGQRSLVDRATAENDEVAILLGTTLAALNPHDPLPYEVREPMVRDAYPTARILALPNMPTNEMWAVALDELLERTYGANVRIRLYGSRSSFIPCYKGKYETVCLPELMEVSGSEVRNGITPENAEAFRKGMIHSANNRYPTSFQTVDIAVINNDLHAVLLGQKDTDGDKWRFPGGFVDPTDDSLEGAAFRELREEAGDLGTSEFRYVGSRRVNDWRYRDSTDKICTALFATDFHYGRPVASDDLARIAWVPITELMNVLVGSHEVLGKMLIAHLSNK